MPETTISFAAATALRRVDADRPTQGVLSSTRFDVDISDEWTIYGKPNGGYLSALLVKAAIASSSFDHVVACSVQFLESPQCAPASIVVDLVRDGRSAHHMRAGLIQNGSICVEALITLGTLTTVSQPYWQRGIPDKPEWPPGAIMRVPDQSPDGNEVAMYRNIAVNIDVDCLGFVGGKPSGNGEFRGTVELLDEDTFDSVALVMALDSFPPAPFEVMATGWVPTMSYTTYIRALPAAGPLTVLHRAQLIEGERVDEVTYLWDSQGVLVAQATQLAGIRTNGRQ